MKTSSCLRSTQPDYIDVDIYVTEDDNSEWNFSIFKDREMDRICFGSLCWASADSCFEETDKTPGIEVWIAVIEEMPRVLKFIQEIDNE